MLFDEEFSNGFAFRQFCTENLKKSKTFAQDCNTQIHYKLSENFQITQSGKIAPNNNRPSLNLVFARIELVSETFDQSSH